LSPARRQRAAGYTDLFGAFRPGAAPDRGTAVFRKPNVYSVLRRDNAFIPTGIAVRARVKVAR
jgi:hypothetical protein